MIEVTFLDDALSNSEWSHAEAQPEIKHIVMSIKKFEITGKTIEVTEVQTPPAGVSYFVKFNA